MAWQPVEVAVSARMQVQRIVDGARSNGRKVAVDFLRVERKGFLSFPLGGMDGWQEEEMG